ncbi:hypothetical protein CGMCC3_g6383 [Colletotrichum fructicola]|nr:uncharacterized protein CGMCC3_g6383 [Colletotrichum fructicola]KAE9577722.1 hypothetical protein CGMCC3_g6383 [Colletotrichum fructicola]
MLTLPIQTQRNAPLTLTLSSASLCQDAPQHHHPAENNDCICDCRAAAKVLRVPISPAPFGPYGVAEHSAEAATTTVTTVIAIHRQTAFNLACLPHHLPVAYLSDTRTLLLRTLSAEQKYDSMKIRF